MQVVEFQKQKDKDFRERVAELQILVSVKVKARIPNRVSLSGNLSLI